MGWFQHWVQRRRAHLLGNFWQANHAVRCEIRLRCVESVMVFLWTQCGDFLPNGSKTNVDRTLRGALMDVSWLEVLQPYRHADHSRTGYPNVLQARWVLVEFRMHGHQLVVAASQSVVDWDWLSSLSACSARFARVVNNRSERYQYSRNSPSSRLTTAPL